MSAKEAARLIEWLISHGHTPDDAVKCINFIAYGKDSNSSDDSNDK